MRQKKAPFPSVPIGEFTVCRTFTAPGMFVYRYLQADQLLQFPDLGGGDLTEEQRREALKNSVTLYEPLTALVIFLNVVALEDFIRKLSARLADINGLDKYFPKIKKLKFKVKDVISNYPYEKPDRDFAPLLDFKKVNTHYDECIGVKPFQEKEFPKLYDLAIIRHTIAHHGSIFRDIDVDRFQYYQVQGGQKINPPIEFVKDICKYLYDTGRAFENIVQDRIFSVVMPKLDKTWPTKPPGVLLELIEVFDFFGNIVESSSIVSRPELAMVDYKEYLEENNKLVREKLIKLCIDDLVRKFLTKRRVTFSD